MPFACWRRPFFPLVLGTCHQLQQGRLQEEQAQGAEEQGSVWDTLWLRCPQTSQGGCAAAAEDPRPEIQGEQAGLWGAGTNTSLTPCPRQSLCVGGRELFLFNPHSLRSCPGAQWECPPAMFILPPSAVLTAQLPVRCANRGTASSREQPSSAESPPSSGGARHPNTAPHQAVSTANYILLTRW